MVSKVRLAEKSEISEGQAIVVKGPEGDIALFKWRGQVFALDNACPHEGGPLGEGDVEENLVTCPWHGYQFNICTGQCENGLCEDARRIQVEVLGEEIFLVI